MSKKKSASSQEDALQADWEEALQYLQDCEAV